MSNQHQSEQWIPIVDYAVLKSISTSTLRRYIKAKKIPYRIENGRYLILVEDKPLIRKYWDGTQNLERNLVNAQEQIAELKMLVAIYEEKLAETNR